MSICEPPDCRQTNPAMRRVLAAFRVADWDKVSLVACRDRIKTHPLVDWLTFFVFDKDNGNKRLSTLETLELMNDPEPRSSRHEFMLDSLMEVPCDCFDRWRSRAQ